MGKKRTVEPATLPITLAEAKTQCRVTTADHDDNLNQLIAAATTRIENEAGISLIAQTWQLSLDYFSNSIDLSRGPVASVTSVQYYDTAGTLQTVSSADYTVDLSGDPQRIVINADASWPATQDRINAVVVTYVAGYAILPTDIKHACLLLVGHWFEDAEGVGLPPAVSHLLAHYRAGWAAA